MASPGWGTRGTCRATGRGQILAGGRPCGRTTNGGQGLGAASFPVGGRAPRRGPGRFRRRRGASSGPWPGGLRGNRRRPRRPDPRGVPLGPPAVTHHVRTRTLHGPKGPARQGRPAGRRPTARRPIPLPGALPPLGPPPRQDLPGPTVPAAPDHAPRRPLPTIADLRDSRTGGRPHHTSAAGTTRAHSAGKKLGTYGSGPPRGDRTRGRGDLGVRPASRGPASTGEEDPRRRRGGGCSWHAVGQGGG